MSRFFSHSKIQSRDKISLVLSLIRHNERDILEIGCGGGEITRHLNVMGKRVVGVEIDQDKARIAKRFCKELITGDIESKETINAVRSLNYHYDIILCSEVLEHLKHPEQTLQKLHTFLEPGAAILVVLPNVAFYKTRLMLLAGRWGYADEGILDRTHLRFFTKETAELLLIDTGYKIITSQATHYSSHYAFIYDRLVKWFPRLFGEQFVIRATLA